MLTGRKLEEVEMARRYIYTLTGRVGYIVNTNDGPDYFNGEELEEELAETNDATAVKAAEKIINEFLEENKKHDPRVNGSADEESVLEFELKKTILRMEWVPAEPAKLAVPAKPAVPAHVKAVRF